MPNNNTAQQPILPFIDAGGLIMAARHELELAAKAMAILGNPQQVFASSEFIKLEVLPKAVYHKNEAKVKFYQLYFNAVTHWVETSDNLINEAY